ncbi:hypothetical protein BC628DRAFT_509008 [Trametes gibbosa]|nr:hypothetical protein BC628DRAFT_509008 [Trametes gibbosa]
MRSSGRTRERARWIVSRQTWGVDQERTSVRCPHAEVETHRRALNYDHDHQNAARLRNIWLHSNVKSRSLSKFTQAIIVQNVSQYLYTWRAQGLGRATTTYGNSLSVANAHLWQLRFRVARCSRGSRSAAPARHTDQHAAESSTASASPLPRTGRQGSVRSAAFGNLTSVTEGCDDAFNPSLHLARV